MYFLEFRALWSQVIFHNFFWKSVLGFQKWTKINVQNQKPNLLFGKLFGVIIT